MYTTINTHRALEKQWYISENHQWHQFSLRNLARPYTGMSVERQHDNAKVPRWWHVSGFETWLGVPKKVFGWLMTCMDRWIEYKGNSGNKNTASIYLLCEEIQLHKLREQSTAGPAEYKTFSDVRKRCVTKPFKAYQPFISWTVSYGNSHAKWSNVIQRPYHPQ